VIINNYKSADKILDHYKSFTGRDFNAYRNHVYRVVNFCFLVDPELTEKHLEILFTAACFHDLGIWANDTLDYLKPSEDLAEKWIAENQTGLTSKQVRSIISFHHKITEHSDSLVELFRKADWMDVTWGFRNFKISRKQILSLYKTFPDAGFHFRLIQLSFREFFRHPLRPVPIFKW